MQHALDDPFRLWISLTNDQAGIQDLLLDRNPARQADVCPNVSGSCKESCSTLTS